MCLEAQLRADDMSRKIIERFSKDQRFVMPSTIQNPQPAVEGRVTLTAAGGAGQGDDAWVGGKSSSIIGIPECDRAGDEQSCLALREDFQTFTWKLVVYAGVAV